MKIYIITEQNVGGVEILSCLKGPQGQWQSVYTNKHDAEWAFAQADLMWAYVEGRERRLHELDTERNFSKKQQELLSEEEPCIMGGGHYSFGTEDMFRKISKHKESFSVENLHKIFGKSTLIPNGLDREHTMEDIYKQITGE